MKKKRPKLSDSDVRWIRKMYTRAGGIRATARMFKVSAPYISDIVARKRRAKVPDRD
jgi:hypothetical protein